MELQSAPFVDLGRTVLKHAWFPLARTRRIKPGKPISRAVVNSP